MVKGSSVPARKRGESLFVLKKTSGILVESSARFSARF